MRFLMTFKIPHESFHRRVREGNAGQTIGRLVETTKPEHIFFTEQAGYRAGVAIYELDDVGGMCRVAEPWFLALDAECTFSLAMTPEDLANVPLDELAKQWT